MLGISGRPRASVIALAFTVISGCAHIDNSGAAALALAGQSAANALAGQTALSRKLVASNVLGLQVKLALDCRLVKPSLKQGCLEAVKPANPTVDLPAQQIETIMRKRELAFSALQDAYAAFAELVAYDARGEVAKSLGAVGGTLDSLLTALSLPVIGPVMQKAVGDVLGTAAENQKNKQILIVSRALHSASDALALALRTERDTEAMHSLRRVLTTDQDDLYVALIDTGLLSPHAVLGSFVSEQFPGTVLAGTTPADNTAVIRAAAKISYLGRSADRQRVSIEAYDRALEALSALSAQHAKLESGVPLDLATILTRAKEIQQLINEFTRP
jgi:hypothetical protein